ncbi:MAG: hypothetical protein EBQ96_01335 [Proteobacteria bacterium]|nr:hypothetical protein [Pseudomonadota bacterium]
MFVTLNSPHTSRKPALAPLVRRARELAGSPVFRKAERRKTERHDSERTEAGKAETDRFLKLRQEWKEAEAKRIREEEASANDFWLTMIIIAYFTTMFRQNPQFQPDVCF